MGTFEKKKNMGTLKKKRKKISRGCVTEELEEYEGKLQPQSQSFA